MSNFLIFKAAFNNSATPAIGTYTAEGATAQFNRNTSISPDYYLYNNADGTAVQWFVPTAETTDFEFVADILTRQWTNRVTYFIIADSTGTTRLRMWSQYNNWFFENSDSTAGSGDPEYIGTVSPTTSGGFNVFHQFRVRVRKLTASSSSVEVYVDGTLELTATAGAALITCAKIGFVGGVSTWGPGTDAGIKNAYAYDLSGGEVIDRGVLSGAFNRFISWMKSKFALKSDIPTVNDATLTIQKNGTNVATFTANQSTNATANITVPTKTSDLTNDSGFITSDNTKIPLAGSNAISGSLIPSTNGTVNLGSSSYQWNNLYAKNYYYNGTQWGLGQANVWTNIQRMTNNPAVWYLRNNTVTLGTAPSSNRYIGMFFEDVNGADLGYVSFQANKNGHNSIAFNLRNHDGTNAYTGVLRYRASTTGDYSFFPETSECDLGISTNKWKTLNGVNPGALSLPSSTYINVDTTNWDLTCQNGLLGSFTPTADGWLMLSVDNSGTSEVNFWIIGGVIRINNKSSINTTDNNNFNMFTIPVEKDVTYNIYGNASEYVAGRSIAYCRFMPCRGNI